VSFRPLALALTALLALGACREQRPWSASDWRPALPPQRIVAASVLATEVLLAIAPRERIAAVHVLAADPTFSLVATEARAFALVGAEPEQLLAARPDLVICDAFTRPETLAMLDAADVPVVRTGNPASFADVAANVRRLGQLCHAERGAERLVDELERRLAALAARAGDVAQWRVANLDGALHTHGAGSLFEGVVRAAGAQCLAAQRGVGPFRKLDVETLLAWQPDALVVAGPADASTPPEWLLQQPGAALLTCVQRNRVLQLPAPVLATTSHRLVAVAETLQRALLRWEKP
jgi:ABC-type Fe3+-hydroxamate transport system substrate-binding protein